MPGLVGPRVATHSTATNSSENDLNTNTTTEVAEQISETSVQQQITFDQRTVPTATGYLDGSNALPVNGSVDEDEFSHLDILKQPVKVASSVWVNGSPVATQLLTINVPNVLADLPTIHRQLLQTYAYLKLTLRLRIVLNTTKFHCGKLLAAYVPFGIEQYGKSRPVDNIFSLSGFPHVVIDAGDSNSAEFDVPFEHILTFLTTNSTEIAPPMGEFQIYVLNPLQVSTGGSTTVTINVFASAGAIDLHIPMRPHDVTFDSSSTIVETNINLKGIVSAVGDVASTVTGAVADVKSGNIGGLLTRAKDFFSLDRPANIDSRQGNCLATVSAPCHMLGLDQAVRMGATQDGAYLETSFSTAPASDMLIENIITKPMLFAQPTWGVGASEDVVLAEFAVHPGLCNYIDNPVVPTEIIENPTFLSYFSKMFEFWRGGITFSFDFAATQFHSGRLMFVFEPNVTQGLLPGVDASVSSFSNNPHMIFDLRESKKISFSIPYVGSSPRKRCVPPSWCDQPANAVDTDLLGYLRIIVVSPLVIGDNFPSTIQFNCWISASPGFKFYAPRIRNSTRFQEEPIPSDYEIVTNAGDDIMLRENQKSQPIIKTTRQIDTPNYFGEDIRDVRDLARRYSRYNTNQQLVADPTRTGVVTGYTSFGIHPDLFYAANSETNIPKVAHSFASMICRLYAMWSGSIRFKFVPITDRTKSLQMTPSYFFNDETDDTPSSNTDYSAYPMFVTNTAQDTSLELEFPFYSLYTQNLVYEDQTGGYTDAIYTPGFLQLTSSSLAGAFPSDVVNITMFHAIGDDFAFRFLVSPPYIIDAKNRP